jgi:beta-glucosidase
VTAYPNAGSDTAALAILRRLTLDEKIALLHQYAPAVRRLGLAAFRTGTEVLHGLAWLGSATVLPQPVGLAATWNTALVERAGALVADEVRAVNREDPTCGLNVWGPVANLLRDPRWGRNEEGYSEDPHLTARMAIAYARGLSTGTAELPAGAELATAPTLKHFLAYNNEADKDNTSASLRPRVKREYDMVPFAEAVAAGAVTGVMPSYNQVNGRPGHLNPDLAELRRLNPELTVLSDAYAPLGLVMSCHYHDDYPHAFAHALRTGLDSFTCDNEDPTPTVRTLAQALGLGLLDEGDIDRAAARLLRMRERLGEFGHGERRQGPSRSALVSSAAHRKIARETALQGVVLLSDPHGTLPFRPEACRRVAVIGHHAGSTYLDWFSGTPTYLVTVADAVRERLPDAVVEHVPGLDTVRLQLEGSDRRLALAEEPGRLALTAAPGAADRFALVDWGEGAFSFRSLATGLFVSVDSATGELRCDQEQPNGWVVRETFRLDPCADGHVLRCVRKDRLVAAAPEDGRLVTVPAEAADQAAVFTLETVAAGTEAVRRAAEGADAVIVVAGSHPLINGRENEDRMSLDLPQAQQEVIAAARRANPEATAVCLVSGFPLAVGDLARSGCPMLWTSHAGQELGTAVTSVLFGDHSPSGRLQQTWYESAADLGDITDYDIITSRKTYLYYDGDPVFPFGHGLSYRDFRYGPARCDLAEVRLDDRLRVEVEVTNTSDAGGHEVVQVYCRPPDRLLPRPHALLCGFAHVWIDAGETVTVPVEVSASRLAHWDVADHAYVLEPGRHELLVGRSSRDVRATVSVTTTGPARQSRSLSVEIVRAEDFDGCHGVSLVAEGRSHGTAVAFSGPGSWISFVGTEIPVGAAAAVVRLRGGPAHGTGPALELRVGDPLAGRVVGRLAAVDVHDGWATYDIALEAGVCGRHDVYLVAGSPLALAGVALR